MHWCTKKYLLFPIPESDTFVNSGTEVPRYRLLARQIPAYFTFAVSRCFFFSLAAAWSPPSRSSDQITVTE